jgi:hypothetical protein
MPDAKLQALSIRQPWAWLIVHGYKDVENRTWSTPYRGRFLIHAGLVMTRREYIEACAFVARIAPDISLPAPARLKRGGIVGEAEIVDCVARHVGHRSPWFVGDYGFVMRNARPVEFVPCKGALGFFYPEVGR